MVLESLGWDAYFEREFEFFKPQSIPGRVVSEQLTRYSVYTETGIITAELAGRLRYQVKSSSAYPVVGDWIAVSLTSEGNHGIIQGIIPRKSKFSRKVPGVVIEEQIIAANIDFIFVVISLELDLNRRRLERTLLSINESGTQAVVVLNKADLCSVVEDRVNEVQALAGDAPILAISAETGQGLDLLKAAIPCGKTVTMIGASGVGKSTLINCLLGNAQQKTGAVRDWDGKGRHTTTTRELLQLPWGGLIIDNPGMREFQLWVDEDQLLTTFQDIETLAVDCRFTDCQHENEPGCAVLAACDAGELARDRLGSYRKLRAEVALLNEQQAAKTRLEERLHAKRRRSPPLRIKNKR